MYSVIIHWLGVHVRIYTYNDTIFTWSGSPFILSSITLHAVKVQFWYHEAYSFYTSDIIMFLLRFSVLSTKC